MSGCPGWERMRDAERDALRAENERLKEELGYVIIQRDDARYGSQTHQATIERLRGELHEQQQLTYVYADERNEERAAKEDALQQNERLRAALVEIRKLVDRQAEDEALWLLDPTIGEAYLQQELRRLHSVIESAWPI